METIISSVIAAAVTLLVCIINNSQQAARTRNLLDYKLEQLTKRVDKHNNVIERTYELEKRTDIQEEQIRVANHRIADLEEYEYVETSCGGGGLFAAGLLHLFLPTPHFCSHNGVCAFHGGAS